MGKREVELQRGSRRELIELISTVLKEVRRLPLWISKGRTFQAFLLHRKALKFKKCYTNIHRNLAPGISFKPRYVSQGINLKPRVVQ